MTALTAAALNRLRAGRRVQDAIGDVYVKTDEGLWDTPFDDTPAVTPEQLVEWGPLTRVP